MSEFVTIARSGRTATITLDRPEKKNALAMEMVTGINDALLRLSSDEELRVIVLTGAGDTFSAGADIDEFLARTDAPIEEITYGYQQALHELYTSVETAPVPIIARINGIANGGGAELVLACDIRIGASTSGLALGEINFAIIPPFARLSREIGPAVVRELCYTGWELSAEEANAANVFNRVVEPQELDAAVKEYTREVEGKSRQALTRTKQAMWHAKRQVIDAEIEHRRIVESQCFAHPDFRESVEAFKENREPEYAN